jgi:hypothetical protein
LRHACKTTFLLRKITQGDLATPYFNETGHKKEHGREGKLEENAYFVSKLIIKSDGFD